MIVDATVPLHPAIAVWPGDAQPDIRQTSQMTLGAGCNITFIGMGVHTGTHIDAPRHFIPDGNTIEQIDPAVFVGQAYVVDTGDADMVTAEHVESAPDCERLVFRTRNTRDHLMRKPKFDTGYCAISPEAASTIVARGIRLVGIDYLSIERFGGGEPVVHQTILGAGIVAVEGLDLEQAEPDWWELICLPLKIAGSDGSPVRAIFRR